MIINISTEDVHLKKGAVFGFLEPTDINSNDLISETIYETVFQNESPTCDSGGNLFNQNENNIQEKRLYTSPADMPSLMKQVYTISRCILS